MKWVQRPAQPINTAQMRIWGAGGFPQAGLEDKYELPVRYGMYVGLCHRQSVQVEVKSSDGQMLMFKSSPVVLVMGYNVSYASALSITTMKLQL